MSAKATRTRRYRCRTPPNIGWHVLRRRWPKRDLRSRPAVHLQSGDVLFCPDANWMLPAEYLGSLGTASAQVVPLFYDDRSGWLQKVRRSLETLAAEVDARRMVGEYVERFYEPVLTGP